MKMVCKDVNNLSKNDEQKFYFKDILANAILTGNMTDFHNLIVNIYVIKKPIF